MADDNVKDDDVDANDVVVNKGNSVVKIILIVVLVIVLIVASIGATLFFAGVIGGEKKLQDVAVEQSEETEKPEKKGKIKKEPVYYAFDPAFVVNFNDGKSIRYLQLTLEIMTYNALVVDDVEKHMPVIRNNLIMMLSNLNYEVINTVAGKRKLQDEALTEIKSILLEKTGKEGVEEVYFTGFVMQ